MMNRCSLCLLLPVVLAGCEQSARKTGTTTTAPSMQASANAEVRAALDAFGETVEKAKSLSVDLSSTFRMTRGEAETKVESALSMAFQRPDRVAIRLVRGTMGADLVADGRHLYAHVPSVNKYSEEAQEGDLPVVADMDTPLMLSVPGPVTFCITLLRNDIATDILEEAKGATSRGRETIDGRQTHHLHFDGDSYDWDLWLASEGERLPVRVQFDLSKSLESDNSGAGTKKPEALIDVQFTHWQINPELPSTAFAFVPPEGVQKVAKLFESRVDESPMLGKAAPPLKLKLLDGGTLDLAEHRGKDVVVLDFWATWCGPCVMAMPVLQRVTDSLKDQGVVLYAVNQSEDAPQIRSFLTRHKDLKVAVALDSDGKGSASFQVEGIPYGVVIGKDGRIQSLHMGYAPSLRRKLRRELRALLDGKDLAAARRKSIVIPAVASQPAGMRQIWSIDGAWDGIATDPVTGAIIVVSSRGPAAQIGPDGSRLRDFKLAHPGGIIRLGNLAGDTTPEIITFDVWGGAIAAHQNNGQLLWAYPGGGGVDDVCLADLNDDGMSEVIIGYNGAAGLNMLDHAGKQLWKNTQVGRIWNVSAGPLGPGGQMQIVAASGLGLLHLFGVGDGKQIKDLNPGFRATMIRVGRSADPNSSPILIAGGSDDSAISLAFLDANGTRLASAAVDRKDGNIDSACVARKRPWVAIGLRGGTVKVFNTNGQWIAETRLNAQRTEVAFNESRREPLLLVATGRALVAFALASTAAPAAASSPVP